jgi:sialic acid synthase SpsE
MDTVRSFKKPTIISLGIADEKLSKEIINFFMKKNFFQYNNNLCLMHCVSSYPADKHLINLNSIPCIQNLNKNLSVGFSDHTIGIEVTKMAYLLGAKIIEKHFTLSNNFSGFRDHKLSLNPENFKKLICSINEIDTILGKKKIIINEEELININSMRRKIVLAKNKEKNSTLKKNDFIFLRCNEIGILAENTKKIINKKINQDLKQFTVLKKKYLTY